MATTLAADVAIADTTIQVNVGHDPIAVGDTLTIEAEELKVTSSTGADIGVNRAQNATSAAAHVTGTSVTITSASKSICAQIAVDPNVTPAGFVPIPTHVYLGTCTDAASDPTWQEVKNVESITIPSPSVAMLDVNNLANSSGIVLQIPGLATPGDISMVVNYWPDESSHNEIAGLIKLSQTREVRPWKIEDQYSAERILRVTFAGFITALPLPFQASAPMKLTCTLRQYGPVQVERIDASTGQPVLTVEETAERKAA